MGRAADSTLVLKDDYASSRHARFFPSDAQWIVEDLGSTNGTWIELDRVEQHELSNQQEFRIGSHVLMFIVTDVE